MIVDAVCRQRTRGSKRAATAPAGGETRKDLVGSTLKKCLNGRWNYRAGQPFKARRAAQTRTR